MKLEEDTVKIYLKEITEIRNKRRYDKKERGMRK
jgi:cytidylate kinase